MIFLRRKKCEKIIDRLVQEYHSRHCQEAKNLVGEISIDHISRGLANSTIVVSQKLTVMYDYIDKLIDFLFHSLEKDFPSFPLKACKQTLINAVDAEYKSLPACTNKWLMEANMLQPDIIKPYEKGISKKREDAKERINNGITLLQERLATKKSHDRWQFIKGVASGVVISLITFGIIGAIKWLSDRDVRPNVDLYFAGGDGFTRQIGITGPKGKRFFEIKTMFYIANNGSISAENVKLKLSYNKNVKITSGNYSYLIWKEGDKSVTLIELNDINPIDTSRPLSCKIELSWSSIDMIDMISPMPSFITNKITNKVTVFTIKAKITAKDMKPVQIPLNIFIGTREALKSKKFTGEVFEVGDNGELIKTSL